MTFRLTYSQEPEKIIPAVLIDTREGTVLANQIGVVIKAATDAEASIITSDVLFYKIETEQGNLAGYVALKLVEGGAVVYAKRLRAAFQQFDAEISTLINNFILSGKWRFDYL